MVVSIAKANIFLISNFIWHHLHAFFLTDKLLSFPMANPVHFIDNLSRNYEVGFR